MPAARRAVRSAAFNIHRYPDPRAGDVADVLAEVLGVAPETITVGQGAAEVLHRLCRTYGAGREFLTPAPAFTGYRALAEHAGMSVRTVPLTADGDIDLEATAAAITVSTRILVLSQPHNPTGTMVDPAHLGAFLRMVDQRVLIVLDEAYVEFAEPDIPDGIALAARHWAAGRDNVVVLRTFSKAYGLAGLRIGYLISPPMLTAVLAEAASPHEIVNSVAQAAAVAALRAPEALARRRTHTSAERARLRAALHELGFVPPRSHANFLWLPLGEDADRFAHHCLRFGVAAASFAEYGVRVTIGRRPDNDLLLAAARAWARGG